MKLTAEELLELLGKSPKKGRTIFQMFDSDELTVQIRKRDATIVSEFPIPAAQTFRVVFDA